MRRWKGGITNDKKYFSGKRWEKVLTAVKNNTKQGWGLLVVGFGLLVLGCWFWVIGCWLLVGGCWLLVTLYYTTHNPQPTLSIPIESKKKKVCNIIAFRLQKLCF